MLTISNHRALLVIFRLCRSDIFATQKRYCRFAAAILYSPLKLGEAQYHLQSKYNWRSQYNSPKANIAEKDSDCITIRVFFWQRDRDSNPNKQSQSLSCYRYTIPLGTSDIILSVFAVVNTQIQKNEKIL